MTNRTSLALLLALAAPGCIESETACDCAPCPPPYATVSVSDAATGGPVAGASVMGGGVAWLCAPDAGKTLCTPAGPLEGGAPIALTVSAPGYAPGGTAVVATYPHPTRGTCCGGCATYAAAPVALQALP
ncbi:MAG: hypothetical protein QM704_04915 [Anaeromyxobacteraceae bacterium]